MPNWTANSVIITANTDEQKAKIKELHNRMFNGDETFLDGLFEYFVPSSKGDDWYQSNIDNWGTKWDAHDVTLEDSDEETFVQLTFDTAWSPPEAFLIVLKPFLLQVEIIVLVYLHVYLYVYQHYA